MNSVEIEDAVFKLVQDPFDAVNFPFAFLEAFGNKPTTIQRLKKTSGNKSDIDKSDIAGALLQPHNIHIATCTKGEVIKTLDQLRASPATTKHKAKFILATDGQELQAEDLTKGEPLVCEYIDLPDNFGFFLSLAGISTASQIHDSHFDTHAARHLNRLYAQLLQDNPTWSGQDNPAGSGQDCHANMDHFMAQLIFCFFAEKTGIFTGSNLFTTTVERMSTPTAANTHEVMGEIFRAMTMEKSKREAANLPRWVKDFPHVNGGLFSNDTVIPHFSKIARGYLLRIGALDWRQVNPDIFGSMIQAMTDEAERSQSGMHYTSVPNILKLLNPLFLDDLRAQLARADTPVKLLNLRKRLARIRVFDPACGSGNFLIIAYKEMRAIEAEINQRRGEEQRPSDIPLTNFRGIELKKFPSEIARLALIIAEYQCNVLYRGAMAALDAFLPLKKDNWIVHGNALRLDWLSICPPAGVLVTMRGEDLFSTPPDQAGIDFANEGGETYLCGNPPYLGSTWQSKEQKDELKAIFNRRTKGWKSLDYVAAWFLKAADYATHTRAQSAFVATNSICQGQQVGILWPLIFNSGHEISFAYTSFKWANLASDKAGVSVVIVGISNHAGKVRRLFYPLDDGTSHIKEVDYINAYLVAAANVIVNRLPKPANDLAEMSFGNKPVDGGHLLLTRGEVKALGLTPDQQNRFIRRIFGAEEFIHNKERYCLWIEDENLDEALDIAAISQRIEGVRNMRLASAKKQTRELANTPHRFVEATHRGKTAIVVPCVSSENRPYLPVGFIEGKAVISNSNFALYDAPLWHMALLASRLHLVWITTICGKLETRFRYSNTLGWNTFPVPRLTRKNRVDLTRCAENILLAREAHFPATIADLYAAGAMPEDLTLAHAANDEVVERIYIGRHFKHDSERLEKLFELYTKMKTITEKIPFK